MLPRVPCIHPLESLFVHLLALLQQRRRRIKGTGLQSLLQEALLLTILPEGQVVPGRDRRIQGWEVTILWVGEVKIIPAEMGSISNDAALLRWRFKSCGMMTYCSLKYS